MQNSNDRHSPSHSGAALARGLRLWSGVLLFAYLVTHFANIALGLISLEVMESGRNWFTAAWRSTPGTLVLYGSLTIHMLLSLWSLYQRHHFRIPFWEGLQIILGLAIFPLLVAHLIGTRISGEWFNTSDSYTVMVLVFWKLRPDLGLKQAILLAVAWCHGCMALHYWLRLKSWYTRRTAIILSIAILWPILALLGFSQAGREVSHLSLQSGWIQETLQARALAQSQRAALDTITDALLIGFGAGLAIMLAARTVRLFYEHFRKSIRITYPGGKEVVVPMGFTVLEAGRHAAIPHAAACGGRGRCSTCRVRVLQGQASLPPASAEEMKVLNHIGAPPNVRLACQLKPTDHISVIPLLSTGLALSEGLAHPMPLAGREKEIVVLFADLRGFTLIAERKLPYDVVFLLNQYFDVVGGAIEAAGGIANQFTGDGAMALFSIDVTPETGCRQALAAACAMVKGLANLSGDLTEELKEPLRMGIGIHTGPAVVGHMGRGMAMYLTAVGDTVHVASRFQEATKEYGCQIIISNLVAERAGVDVSAFPRYEILVRNRLNPILIRAINDVQELEGRLMVTRHV